MSPELTPAFQNAAASCSQPVKLMMHTALLSDQLQVAVKNRLQCACACMSWSEVVQLLASVCMHWPNAAWPSHIPTHDLQRRRRWPWMPLSITSSLGEQMISR